MKCSCLAAGRKLSVLSFMALAACVGGEHAPRKARAEADQEHYRGKPEGGEPEEGELKRGSGISQVGLVVPGGRAQPSSSAPGVEAERLWSVYDD